GLARNSRFIPDRASRRERRIIIDQVSQAKLEPAANIRSGNIVAAFNHSLADAPNRFARSGNRKFAMARTPSPARETRALPGFRCGRTDFVISATSVVSVARGQSMTVNSRDERASGRCAHAMTLF